MPEYVDYRNILEYVNETDKRTSHIHARLREQESTSSDNAQM
jgi:hypothetical protein